jgi:hypothetical protein
MDREFIIDPSRYNNNSEEEVMDKINKKFFHVNELKKGMMNCEDNEKKKKLIIDLTHQIISLNMELALYYSELNRRK